MPSEYELPLSAANVHAIKKLNNVISVTRVLYPLGMYEEVFPFNRNYNWNRDNFGPIVLPKKGRNSFYKQRNIASLRRE